jgi:hypothetical protein
MKLNPKEMSLDNGDYSADRDGNKVNYDRDDFMKVDEGFLGRAGGSIGRDCYVRDNYQKEKNIQNKKILESLNFSMSTNNYGPYCTKNYRPYNSLRLVDKTKRLNKSDRVYQEKSQDSFVNTSAIHNNKMEKGKWSWKPSSDDYNRSLNVVR